MGIKKKILMLSLTIPVANTADVFACKSGEASTSHTLAEKIASINSINLKTLKSAGIKLKRNFSEVSYNDFLNYLGIQNLFPQNGDSTTVLQKVVDNIATIDMANQFLFDISSKIPAYGWINQKLRWQTSSFGLTDFISSSNSHKDFYNIVSGWMKSTEDWSLSVTFLTSDKKGWKPSLSNSKSDYPEYARININKKASFDENGILDPLNSNPGATHKSVDNTNRAFEAIPSDNGDIYQGLYYSSGLIDVSSIYESVDDSNTIFPTNVVDLSITAFDWVNNLSQANLNTVLEDRQKAIEDRLTKWFEAHNIYLTEDDYDGTKTLYNTFSKIGTKSFMISQMQQRLINQVNLELDYTVLNRSILYKNNDSLYKECLTSLSKIFNNIKYGLKQAQTRDAGDRIYKYDEDILEQLTKDGNKDLTKKATDQLKDDDGSDFTVKYFIDNADRFYSLSEGENLSTNQIASIMSLVSAVIGDKTIREYVLPDLQNQQKTEIDFNGENHQLTSSMNDTYMSDSASLNLKDISQNPGSYMDNFTPLGLSYDLKFVFYYYTTGYNPSGSIAGGVAEKQLLYYDPDKNWGSSGDKSSITTQIFRNIFAYTRISTLLPNILSYNKNQTYFSSNLNTDNAWTYFKSKLKDGETISPEDVFGVATNEINSNFFNDIFDSKNSSAKIKNYSSNRPLKEWSNPGGGFSQLPTPYSDQAFASMFKKDLFEVKAFAGSDGKSYNGLIGLSSVKNIDELTKSLSSANDSSFIFGQSNSYGDVLESAKQWYNYVIDEKQKIANPFLTFKAGISDNSNFVTSLYNEVSDGTNPYWSFVNPKKGV
ncbi:hypothetical protein [Spiroplasma endosymbiont of Aspidapion aeneum]|uniref:hypothetical protein n=1 Tax=Spiroplasma endosymbiont of Aspidapion aeneum TaxID=3066276 RepID=UPI00313AA71E